MNGPPELVMNSPALDLQNLTMMQVWRTDPNKFKPGDKENLQDMLAKASPEQPKRSALCEQRLEEERELRFTLSNLDDVAKCAGGELKLELVSRCDAIINAPGSAKVLVLANELMPYRESLRLVSETVDLLRYRRLPAARIRSLRALLALREIEELIARIVANLAEVTDIERAEDQKRPTCRAQDSQSAPCPTHGSGRSGRV